MVSAARRLGAGPPPRGFTLLEIVVSLFLVAVALTLASGIIPMNVTSLKRSESLQAATLYAIEVLAEAESPSFVPDANHLTTQRDVVINDVTYHVLRVVYAVDASPIPRLYDVVVNVSWEIQPVPVELRTRVYRR